MDPVQELESAILERAERLAAEYRRQAERSRDTLLSESAERLHLREQRETLLARARGERACRRKVQASELELHRETDHLRWQLVEGVEERIVERIEALVVDRERYLPLLKGMVQEGVREIGQPDLVAEFNRHDLEYLTPRWSEFVGSVAADAQLHLHPEPIESLGGVLIRTPDGRIRLNNTFEARLERLESQIHQVILERLLPGDTRIV